MTAQTLTPPTQGMPQPERPRAQKLRIVTSGMKYLPPRQEPITCPTCRGQKGWYNAMPGEKGRRWITCVRCKGKGTSHQEFPRELNRDQQQRLIAAARTGGTLIMKVKTNGRVHLYVGNGHVPFSTRSDTMSIGRYENEKSAKKRLAEVEELLALNGQQLPIWKLDQNDALTRIRE